MPTSVLNHLTDVARLGGDEFIVMAIAAGPAMSHRIRKQLLQSLKADIGMVRE